MSGKYFFITLTVFKIFGEKLLEGVFFPSPQNLVSETHFKTEGIPIISCINSPQTYNKAMSMILVCNTQIQSGDGIVSVSYSHYHSNQARKLRMTFFPTEFTQSRFESCYQDHTQCCFEVGVLTFSPALQRAKQPYKPLLSLKSQL